MANFTTAGVILFVLIGVAFFHPAGAPNDLNKNVVLTKPCEEDIENGVGCEKRPNVLRNLDEVDELKQLIKDLKFSEQSERKKELLRSPGRSHKEGELEALKVKEKEASKGKLNIAMEGGPSSHVRKPIASGARPKVAPKDPLKVVTKVDPSFTSRALSAFENEENQAFLAYLEGPKEGRSFKEERLSFRQKLEALKVKTDEFVKVYVHRTTEGDRASMVQTMDALEENEKRTPDAKALAYKEVRPSFIIQGLDALNEEEKEALIAFLKSTREARPTALLQKLRALRGKKREKDAYIAFLKGIGEGGSSPLLQKLRPLDEEENELFIAFLRGWLKPSSFQPKLKGLKLRKAKVFMAHGIVSEDKDGAAFLLKINALSEEEKEAFEAEARDLDEGVARLLEDLKALPGNEKASLIALLNGNREVRPSSFLRKLRALRGQDREAAIARWVSAAKSGPPSHRRDPSASGGKPRDASKERLNIAMEGGPFSQTSTVGEEALRTVMAHMRKHKKGGHSSHLRKPRASGTKTKETSQTHLKVVMEEGSSSPLQELSALHKKENKAVISYLKGTLEGTWKGGLPFLLQKLLVFKAKKDVLRARLEDRVAAQQEINAVNQEEEEALKAEQEDNNERWPSAYLPDLKALDKNEKEAFIAYLKGIIDGRASSFLWNLRQFEGKDREEFVEYFRDIEEGDYSSELQKPSTSGTKTKETSPDPLKVDFMRALDALAEEEKEAFIAYLEGNREGRPPSFQLELKTLAARRDEVLEKYLARSWDGDMSSQLRAIEALGERTLKTLKVYERDYEEKELAFLLSELKALNKQKEKKKAFIAFLKSTREKTPFSFLRNIRKPVLVGRRGIQTVPGLPQEQGVQQVQPPQPHGAAEGGEEIRSPPGSPRPTQQQATTKKKKNKKKKK